MGDLNLDFDVGTKRISLGDNSSDNLGFIKENENSNFELDISDNNILPNLTASDGVELLVKGNNSPINDDNKNQETKKDDFSFFKPDDNISDDNKIDPTDDSFMMNTKPEEVSGYKPIHRLTPQEIKNEKIDLIYKFKKLESQGIRTTMNYNMNSHLEDMRNEYIKLKKQRETDNSIKFQRKMLMACVTGLEFLNGKFDPFDVKLDGWSESVNENLNDYDEIFEELWDKYGGEGDGISPELRLLMTLAGSAFMFHLTNTMFKSSIPGMDDVLQQNPELMKQFAQAAVGTMNNGGGQAPPPPNPLESMMGGGGRGGNPLGGLMGGLMGGMMGGGRRNTNNNPPSQRPSSPPRTEMNGPDGLDDLISAMNLEPEQLPDLDNISLMSGDTDRKSNSGITLNL
jgi:hypothetical protein